MKSMTKIENIKLVKTIEIKETTWKEWKVNKILGWVNIQSRFTPLCEKMHGKKKKSSRTCFLKDCQFQSIKSKKRNWKLPLSSSIAQED